MTSGQPIDDGDGRDDVADIAVIGMAGRFPGARNLAEFWANVAGGVESISVLTEAELAAGGVPASVRQAPEYVPASSRLDDADCFDASFFGYSPREAALMDPQSRVCLELAWHALEDAGYCSFEYADSVGVFATASLNTYLLQNLAGQLDAQDFVLGLGNIPIVLGNGPDFVATRLSYKLNLRGPSIAVQTACSSSLTAIHMARQSLLNGECDMALAGGVSIYLPQDRGYRWQEGMILSSDGHVRAFDAEADGILFGRGGGIVVLKPLAQALEDGDRIRAVIKGSALNNDGSRKVGFAAPSPTGQSRVISEAMADAGVRADSISYVEAHGTGTTLGDPIEIAGLTEAYRKHTKRSGFCAIGTVKTNIGHLDVAAGVTGFIKTVLMLENRQLPPSLHFRRPNPSIDFASSPFFVNTALRPWTTTGDAPLRAGVSAFGIGGTNAHVILEEARQGTEAKPVERPMYVMRVTARTPEALSALASSVADEIEKPNAPEVGDACYTANVGRAHHAHRAVVRGRSAAELREALSAVATDGDDARVVRGHLDINDAPPVAFLFTGLGAQMVGMGRSLYETQPVFREALERCDVILRAHLERPLLRVIYPHDGESSPIDQATYGQPVMFAFEYALSMLWRSWGVRPAAVLGHSLGEYAGACLSGLLPLEDALRLVATRARLADSLPPGCGMAAAMASEQQVNEAIGVDAHLVSIASINGPESIVMSGPSDALARVGSRLAERRLEVRTLNVTQAFHSGWLDPILDEYERAVAKTKFGRIDIPIISNVTGGVLTDADARDPRYWRRHAREVVRFADGVRTLYDRGIRHFLEMGPHTTATAMAAGCVSDESALFLPSLRRGREDWDQILESLSELYVRGVEVNWRGVDETETRKRVALPLYPFAKTRHWIEPSAAATPRDSHEAPSGQPMLRRSIQSPLFTALAYEVHADPAEHPFLGDHRVLGSVVFPATGYVETALEAVEAATGRRASVIEDLEIPDPLRQQESGAPLAQVILTPDGDGFAFELFSQSTHADDRAWTRHGTGRVLADAPRRGERLALDVIRARCAERRTGEAFYADLAQLGFEYGPLFRGIQSVHVGSGEVLGEIRLPAALSHDAGRFRFHPALLDACLQIVFGLAPRGRALLPLRLGRVELGERQSHLFVHASLRPSSSERGLVCDVRIANERGEVVGSIDAIALQEADAQRWTGAATREWARWLYEVGWRESSSVPKSATPPRRLLIVGGDAGLGEQLAEHAPGAGGSASIVSLDSVVQDAARALMQAAGSMPLDAVVLCADAALPVGSSDPVDSTASTRAMLSLVQAMIAHPATVSARFWIVTRGAQGVIAGDDVSGVFDAPAWGLANVVSLEHPELRCSCVDLDGREAAPIEALWSELSADGAEARVAFRGGQRYVARLTRAERPRQDAPRAGMSRRLEVPDGGTLDELRYVDEPRQQPGRGEVEILVRAAGLNFKDVLTALGRYPGSDRTLGHECAGDVVAVGANVTEFAVGDEVIAFAPGSLATHVIANAHLVARKPANVSFEEAATIAGGFLTAQHALHDLAKIGPSDRVLIHAATGGVGLAAVQIAQRAGATIFATAGSDAKRARLTALGVEHVFNSRNADFAAQIASLTNGQGVTVVLNSLTGEMLERSVSSLAPGGRFVELGLSGTMSAESRDRLAREASYTNPIVTQECVADPARFGRMLRDVVGAVERAELSALPVQAFEANDAASAFRLMARAGHIGKVVVRQNSRIAGRTVVRSDASYLITGGLGDLGLLVADWLVERGARHVALMARREIDEHGRAAVAKLVAKGAHVEVVIGDVSRRADVDRALNHIAQTCPAIRGVIQSAGMLDDGVLAQQTWERFARVMAPKVAGSWHLHEALAEKPLDFFVEFSSVASLLGSKGQGNHAAANAFMDALARHRRARGLPALSINWGAWANIGAAARRNIGSRIASRGWSEIPPAAGLEILEHVFEWPRAQVGVAPTDWQAYRQEFAQGQEPTFLAEMLPARRASSNAQEKTAPAAGIADRVQQAAPGERRAIVAQFVRDCVAKGLGLDATTAVDGDRPLSALGLDSLLAVELRNTLNKRLALPRRLPATLLFDFPSINALTEHLLETIAPVATPIAVAPVPIATTTTTVVDEAEIAAMTDEEAEALLLEELG